MKTVVRRILDVVLTAALLLLMSMQVTKQLAHEWIGIALFALTILHQVLNRKYCAAIFKGKYTPLRVFRLTVNTLLLMTFVCTPLTGMMMSRYTTTFMNGWLKTSLVRQGHLALSHWSFVLMGVHLGLHFGVITGKLPKGKTRIASGAVMSGISVYGFYLFFQSNIFDYMFLKIPFAFLDYSKAWWQVIFENLAMLLAWGFAAYLLSLFLKAIVKKDKRKTAVLFAVTLIVIIAAALILKTGLNPQTDSPSASWAF